MKTSNNQSLSDSDGLTFTLTTMPRNSFSNGSGAAPLPTTACKLKPPSAPAMRCGLALWLIIAMMSITIQTSRALDFGDVFGHPCPSIKAIHEFLWAQGSFYTDMADVGWFARTMSTDTFTTRTEISSISVGNIEHTNKGSVDHYVADVSFTISDPEKGVKVAGQMSYYNGVNGEILLESRPWKQTAAKRFGKW